jgi:hypothetical protein
MWSLSPLELRDAWAPHKGWQAECPIHKSKVAFLVAQTLLEDAPHILRGEDITLPSSTGDDERAQLCMRWLVRRALPIWEAHYKGLGICGEELAPTLKLGGEPWTPTTATELTEELHRLVWDRCRAAIPRTYIHKAQQIGMRAVYRGAAQWDNKIAPTMALHCILIILNAFSADQLEGRSMELEAEQSSALMLLDKLMEEINAPSTTPTRDLG